MNFNNFFRGATFSTTDISHACRSATKFGRVRGLSIVDLTAVGMLPIVWTWAFPAGRSPVRWLDLDLYLMQSSWYHTKNQFARFRRLATIRRRYTHWIEDCANDFQLRPRCKPCLYFYGISVVQSRLSRAVRCWSQPTTQNSLSLARRENATVHEVSVLLHAPTTWYSLQKHLRTDDIITRGPFVRELKMFLFARVYFSEAPFRTFA